MAFMVRMNESQSAVTEPFTTPDPAEDTFEGFFERNTRGCSEGCTW